MSRTFTFFPALLLLALPNFLYAQFAETIRPSRPGAATEPYTIGARVIQHETGVSLGRVRTLAAGETEPLAGNTLLRLGLGERFELNAMVTYLRRRQRGASGVSDTEAGGRYTVALETDRVPAVAIQTSVLLRWRGEDYRAAGAGVTTLVSAGKSVGDKASLTFNYGFTHDGDTPGVTSFYALAPGISVTDKFGLGADVYGDLGPDFDLNVDVNATFLLGADLMVDLTAAWEAIGNFEADGGDSVYADRFIEAGISWRVDYRRE